MSAENGIVIVTGSNGRIGDAVMRRLAGRFQSIVGFDRKAPAPPPPGCVYIPVEITSDDSVREGLRTIRDHHGAHVASVGVVPGDDDALVIEVFPADDRDVSLELYAANARSSLLAEALDADVQVVEAAPAASVATPAWPSDQLG